MSDDNTRPLIVGQEVPETPYPVKMKGEVIKGFGRGSKELGIPTANLPETSFEEICKCMEPGIYYGWAQEVHIMHEFSEEFYGKELRVIVLGYIRPERDYISVDSLIQDINFDIKVAENSLARDSYVSYKNDSFFMDIKTSIK
nr:3027_t:CDS:2 [Entrophospora candida]